MNGASTPAIGVGSISSIMFSAIDRKSRLMETPRSLIFVLAAFPRPDYVLGEWFVVRNDLANSWDSYPLFGGKPAHRRRLFFACRKGILRGLAGYAWTTIRLNRNKRVVLQTDDKSTRRLCPILKLLFGELA